MEFLEPAGSDSSFCCDKVSIDQCEEKYKEKIYKDNIPSQIYIDLAKYLEKEKKCAGICKKCPHLMYTNCNSRTNPPLCDDEITKYIGSKY